VVSLHDPESPLLGTDVASKAQVLKYLSYGTAELMEPVTTVIRILLARVPFNKKVLDTANAEVDEHVAYLEKRLAEYTYLVGERLTVADLFVASCFYRCFTLTFGKKWRSEHPVFMRWFNTVVKSEYLAYFFDTLAIIDEPVKPPMPAKKEAKKEVKKEEKPAAAAAPAADAPPAEEKKPKHPLELLGKSAIPLDEWKRVYSNKETREEALPYFWNEFYNDNDWSLWKVEYKYNDELTLTFMSNNLVGGFFNRLSGSTKYMFGCAVVYGENNNNGIVGAFLVRGKDAIPAFNVAPDWESYSYSPLDASKQEDKDFVNNMWAWDEPVVINGEKKEIADGKVLK
jgi:elongation factor 1-gamma